MQIDLLKRLGLHISLPSLPASRVPLLDGAKHPGRADVAVKLDLVVRSAVFFACR